MKTHCQLLERELNKAGDSKPKELATGINKHVNRLSRPIDNLVKVSKIKKG